MSFTRWALLFGLQYSSNTSRQVGSVGSENKASRLCPPDGDQATERDKALTALTPG